MEPTFTKLSFAETFKDSFAIGIKNAPSIIGAVVLWIITLWIPYINVGTTIALYLIPMELSKGNVINPLGIFDSKYRKYMGEYLIASALMSLAVFTALIFMVIPAIVISIAWSLTYYIMFEKGKNAIQAIKASNDATYGSKWTMFGVTLVMTIILVIINAVIVGGLSEDAISWLVESGSLEGVNALNVIVFLVMAAVTISVALSVSASFWKQLKNNVE